MQCYTNLIGNKNNENESFINYRIIGVECEVIMGWLIFKLNQVLGKPTMAHAQFYGAIHPLKQNYQRRVQYTINI